MGLEEVTMAEKVSEAQVYLVSQCRAQVYPPSRPGAPSQPNLSFGITPQWYQLVYSAPQATGPHSKSPATEEGFTKKGVTFLDKFSTYKLTSWVPSFCHIPA